MTNETYIDEKHIAYIDYNLLTTDEEEILVSLENLKNWVNKEELDVQIDEVGINRLCRPSKTMEVKLHLTSEVEMTATEVKDAVIACVFCLFTDLSLDNQTGVLKSYRFLPLTEFNAHFDQ